MTILAIDPGKRIGYALFSDRGREVERGVLDFDDFINGKHLKPETHPFLLPFWAEPSGLYIVDQIICEDFTHDPTIKQGGSKHEAAQVIGAVKILCAVSDTRLSMQPANVLSVAMLITGYEKPVTRTGNKKHLPDQDSAWLHGRYWLHANEIL